MMRLGEHLLGETCCTAYNERDSRPASFQFIKNKSRKLLAGTRLAAARVQSQDALRGALLSSASHEAGRIPHPELMKLCIRR